MPNYFLALDTTMLIAISAIALVLLFLIIMFIVRHKNQNVVRTELITSNKYPFQVSDLITYLGGRDNIEDAIGSYSKIKFVLKDNKKIDMPELKKLSTGIIEQSKSISIIFGNISKPLATEIMEQK